jgi:rhamnulokinase
MSHPAHCLAIDMGASSIRLVVGTLESKKLRFEEIHRFKNEPLSIDGHERWDVEQILDEIGKGIAIAVGKYPQIDSLGIDSWGVDFALLDESGQLISLPVAYRDSRTQGMMEKWESLMSRQETFTRSGINFYIFNTLFQLLSLKDSEEIKKAKHLVFMPNYMGYRLSGKLFNEHTIASTSQMLNIQGTSWDNAILANLGVNFQLPEAIVLPGTIVGKVNHPALNAQQTRLIAVCSHDTASAVAATPASNKGFAYISTGTWCILGMDSEKPLLSQEALQLGITNERGFDLHYRVQKNIIGLWLLQGLQKAFPENPDFSEMEQMAAEAHSNFLIDPDNELFFNPQNMKEAFDAYFDKTGIAKPLTTGEYIKCAYDSLCCSFRYYIDRLEKMLGQTIEAIHLIGGGCQSAYLCQTTANATRRKVVSGPVECAVAGNILVQAIALGKLSDLSEAREVVRNSFPVRTYEPLSIQQFDEIYTRYFYIKSTGSD